MDLMDLGHGFSNYAEGVARIVAKTYIIGVDRDMLIPLEEQEHLFKLMQALGKPVRFEIMSSLFGHDVRFMFCLTLSAVFRWFCVDSDRMVGFNGYRHS